MFPTRFQPLPSFVLIILSFFHSETPFSFIARILFRVGDAGAVRLFLTTAILMNSVLALPSAHCSTKQLLRHVLPWRLVAKPCQIHHRLLLQLLSLVTSGPARTQAVHHLSLGETAARVEILAKTSSIVGPRPPALHRWLFYQLEFACFLGSN